MCWFAASSWVRKGDGEQNISIHYIPFSEDGYIFESILSEYLTKTVTHCFLSVPLVGLHFHLQLIYQVLKSANVLLILLSLWEKIK
jgi:hypothetical protein